MEYTVEGSGRRSASGDRAWRGFPAWRRITSVVFGVVGLFAVCTAHAVEADPVIPDGTTTYALLTSESFVTESGSQQTYVVEGRFDLTADIDTGDVAISQADFRATAAGADGFCIDVDALFALTALEGYIWTDGTIELRGKSAVGRHVDLTVIPQGDALHLTGYCGSIPRSGSGGHTLEALAWRQYGGEVTIPDGRSVYTFLPEESTLVQAGGFWGIYRTDPLHGRFELAIDLEAGTGSFVSIDAKPIYDDPVTCGWDANDIFTHPFKVTELVGIVVNESTIYFNEGTPENSCADVVLTLTFENDRVHLVAEEVAIGCPDWLGSSIDAVAQRKYGGGTGEPNYPYLIYTAEQMNAIGAEPDDWDKHFRLMGDIDLACYAETSFNTIGVDINTPFTGVFEGKDHVISNFHCVKEGTDHVGYPWWDTENVGLFGAVDDPNAAIRNVSLEDPNVYAPRSTAVGALVGYLRQGELTRCHVIRGRISAFGPGGGLVGRSSGAITACYAVDGSVTGNSNLGGLVGLNSGTVTACHATSDVDGGIGLGGLVGINGGDITACYTTGGMISGWAHLGGLIGRSDGKVTNCYSGDSVSGGEIVGGLVGDSGGTIRNCYAAGVVSGREDVGGLLGRRYWGQVVASFWDMETTGRSESAAGLGKTTLQMQTVAVFLGAGWDFAGETENGTDDIWWMPEEPGYPRHWWERSAAEATS